MSSDNAPQPIRVLVIDDSRTARELLVAMLESAGGLQVVGVGETGEDAVRLARRIRPDIIAMDIIMPEMDGLEATRAIMREVPTPIVLLTSTLMYSDVNLTFEAMRLGALAVVNKPPLGDEVAWETVLQTMRLMAKVAVVRRWDPEARKTAAPGATVSPPTTTALPEQMKGTGPRPNAHIVGIGSSTGGPAALATILGPLPADFPLPILIVQHITKGFGPGLAEWLNTQTALRVSLAGHGDKPQPGSALMAPDDCHLQINAWGIVELSKEPPYRGLRPSINYMFKSIANVYGPRAVGVQLTGMGDDGAEGLEKLRRQGGWVIAQDEKTCVVDSMPHEVIARKAANEILAPPQIAQRLQTLGHVTLATMKNKR
ncbi:MAG: chemotaxis-specific protein-glutamate methyltransferase CheB [Anaerolineae bacterium]|nr:chemotaxis-specific protein-glutamate methyltransferase CheB [Anaerolineae bacterium]